MDRFNQSNSNYTLLGGPRGALKISLPQHKSHHGIRVPALETISNNVFELEYFTPVAAIFLSAITTLAVFYFIFSTNGDNDDYWQRKSSVRSATLPGYGLLEDKVNDVIQVVLDALAIYVHNNRFDCSRKMLCEANQRASEYGLVYGVITYFLTLSVSTFLKDQRISESMEAMRRGRHGMDCKSSYPHCPFSL